MSIENLTKYQESSGRRAWLKFFLLVADITRKAPGRGLFVIRCLIGLVAFRGDFLSNEITDTISDMFFHTIIIFADKRIVKDIVKICRVDMISLQIVESLIYSIILCIHTHLCKAVCYRIYTACLFNERTNFIVGGGLHLFIHLLHFFGMVFKTLG